MEKIADRLSRDLSRKNESGSSAKREAAGPPSQPVSMGRSVGYWVHQVGIKQSEKINWASGT
jgi:hypothetical protein